MRTVRLRAVLDRIEDGKWAVFSFGRAGSVILPAKLFPRGLREGQVFRVSWTPDAAAERRLRTDVGNLQAALLKRSRRQGR
jgi:hypothetical protein